MESFFNTNIETISETDNLLYNVINSQDPKQLFTYIVIIIIITFISIKISYSPNILIGLIFCSIIIYYLYTYRKYNTLTENQIFKEKFDIIYSKNQILSKYPKIVDFLYYIENLKSDNIQGFDDLIKSFENFCKLYEYCILNKNLIFQSYSTLVTYKIIILNIINNFIFVTKETEYENIIIKQKIAAEQILDELLNNIVILSKKKIYYDGYYTNTKNISYSNVLPYDILNDINYREHYDRYNINNLISY